MSQNLPKTYSILAVLLVACCVVAGYFLMNKYWPNYNLAKSSYSLAMENNAKLKKALDSVQSFLTSFKDQSSNAKKVQLALPAGNSDMPNFISSISQLATASGVGLSNFQVSSPATTGDTPALRSIQVEDLGLNASGSYESFKDFILRVEDHLRLIDIYHVSVSGQTTSGKSDLLQFQIKIHTYFQE